MSDPPMGGTSGSALLPFLPLLYVAWSDGNLDLEELRALCGRVLDVWKMSPEERERVVRWLDPDQPPTARELEDMLLRLRRESAGLSPEDRRSLTELGMALARVSGGGISGDERAALAAIERAIGGSGSRAARAVLREPEPEEEPDD